MLGRVLPAGDDDAGQVGSRELVQRLLPRDGIERVEVIDFRSRE